MTLLAFTLFVQMTPLTNPGAIVRPTLIIDIYPGQSIQSRIDSAQPGDTILVHAGLYRETLSVTKSLTLIGESKENTIIDGDEANRTVIEVTASNVAI
ncbi:hypothetical protein KAH85_03495, partial [Candidatus Bathyarchaeota archaeon]|nr:hypothetical protein [Candidatus Bathyarchaeota archaeon]